MNNYFKLLESVAKCDPTMYSIKDLTIKLMTKAGYYRANYTFAVGTVRERTFYKYKFDDVLTAKWLLYYKKLFVAKLCKHPELSEQYSTIINDTFIMTLNHLIIENITNDKIVSKYVNMTLRHRIAYAMYLHSSRNRFNKNKFIQKSIINQLAASLDYLIDNNIIQEEAYIELYYDPFILDLQDKLFNNKYGLRLLDTLLYSKKKVQLSHIDDFIKIDDGDFTEKTKQDILSAYNIIQHELAELSCMKDEKTNIKPAKYIMYSFERQEQ